MPVVKQILNKHTGHKNTSFHLLVSTQATCIQKFTAPEYGGFIWPSSHQSLLTELLSTYLSYLHLNLFQANKSFNYGVRMHPGSLFCF